MASATVLGPASQEKQGAAGDIPEESSEGDHRSSKHMLQEAQVV